MLLQGSIVVLCHRTLCDAFATANPPCQAEADHDTTTMEHQFTNLGRMSQRNKYSNTPVADSKTHITVLTLSSDDWHDRSPLNRHIPDVRFATRAHISYTSVSTPFGPTWSVALLREIQSQPVSGSEISPLRTWPTLEVSPQAGS